MPGVADNATGAGERLFNKLPDLSPHAERWMSSIEEKTWPRGNLMLAGYDGAELGYATNPVENLIFLPFRLVEQP